MWKKIYLSSFLLYSLINITQAQEVLQSYIKEGIENNLSVIQNQIRTEISQQDAAEMRRSYYPDVSFQSTYTLAGGGRNINIPAGDLVNPAYGALNQLTNSDQFPTDIANVNEQFLPNNFHDTRIVVTQPIINKDLYYGYKIRQAQISLSEAQEEVYKNQLQYQIKEAYYNYIKLFKQREILLSNQNLVNDLIRVNQKLVKNDVATKDIIYRSKGQLNQVTAQIAQVDQNLHSLQAQFNFLLNKDLDEEITVEFDSSTLSLPNSLLDLRDKATLQRSELLQLKEAQKVSTLVRTKNEKYWMPELRLSGNLGFQGFGFNLADEQAYALLGVNLRVPLYHGNTNKIKIQKSVLDQDLLAKQYQEVRQQIQVDITRVYFVIEQNQKMYDAAKFEVKNTSESYKIIAGRYRQGQALLIELDEARNQMTTAKLREVIAFYDIKIAEANLLRALNQ